MLSWFSKWYGPAYLFSKVEVIWVWHLYLCVYSSLFLLSTTESRSSPPDVFLEKVVLKICSKFTGESPCRSVISIKLPCNFIKITLRHKCSLVNLLHIFRTPFPKSTSAWLLLWIPWTLMLTGRDGGFSHKRFIMNYIWQEL